MPAGKKDDKENKTDQAPEAAAEAKQKKKKLFLFIGIGLLLILVSVGSTFFIVSKMMGSKHSGEAADSDSSEAVEVAPAIYYPLKPNFTVNFDVNGRQRFLQTEITLMYRDATVVKILELHMPAVRNGLVMLLSSQSFDELQTAEGKEKLRAAALQTVQDIISKETASAEKSKESGDKDKSAEKKSSPNIEQVLFTQFVMQ